ncbi:MAG: hypothetical protein EZS28_042981, partial [Streblomastix strix]
MTQVASIFHPASTSYIMKGVDIDDNDGSTLYTAEDGINRYRLYYYSKSTQSSSSSEPLNQQSKHKSSCGGQEIGIDKARLLQNERILFRRLDGKIIDATPCVTIAKFSRRSYKEGNAVIIDKTDLDGKPIMAL